MVWIYHNKQLLELCDLMSVSEIEFKCLWQVCLGPESNVEFSFSHKPLTSIFLISKSKILSTRERIQAAPQQVAIGFAFTRVRLYLCLFWERICTFLDTPREQVLLGPYLYLTDPTGYDSERPMFTPTLCTHLPIVICAYST